MNKITVTRASHGGKGGLVSVYLGHSKVWSKRWVTIEQLLEVERRVNAIVKPLNQKLKLVRKGA